MKLILLTLSWLIAVLVPISCRAQGTVSLSFDRLPSAQGWTYTTSGPSEASFGAGQTTPIFYADGTALHQNTIGTGLGAGGTAFEYYIQYGAVDPTKPFVLEVHARVLQSERLDSGGFSFGVSTGKELLRFSMDTSTISDTSGTRLSLNNTVFHDYSVKATPGVGYTFFVDGSQVFAGALESVSVPNQLFIGDATSGGNAKADVTFYQFTEAQPTSGVFPNHGGNAGTVTTLVIASGFVTGATVKLVGIGRDIISSNVNVLNGSTLTATFDLKDAAPGVRNVIVTNPDGTSTTLSAGFTVEQGGTPQLTVEIIGRDKIRFGTNQNYFALIQNHGIVDATNVAAVVSESAGENLASLVQVSSSATGQASPSTFLGTVTALSSVRLPFTAIAPLSGSTSCPSITGKSHIVQPTDPCIVYEAAEAASDAYIALLYGLRLANLLLEIHFVLPPPAGVNFCFNVADPLSSAFCDAIEAADGVLEQEIQDAENAKNGLCLAASILGCPLSCNNPQEIDALEIIGEALVNTIIQLKRAFALTQIPLDQVATLDSQIALFQSQALALPSSLVFPPQPQPQPPTAIPADNSSSLKICGVASLDPNSKNGTPGVGPGGYVQGTLALPYFLTFENTPTATAPAQVVTIVDSLNPNVDLTSLTLGPITLGNQVITPPSIPLSVVPFVTTVDLRPTTNLLVRIGASLNSSANVLTWTFQSLDPTTHQPPTDPLAGFLPPGGDGSVFFSVLPKSTAMTGTVIQNTATVVFDVNAPINTPTWSNTIDNTKPVSAVSPLPATETAPIFPVHWSGADVGAGVQDFTIYVSDNGGPLGPWLTNTTATQGLYPGTGGHSYAFYSTARDLVGNVENGKTAPETSTRVITDTTPPVIVPQITGTLGNNGWYRSNVSVTWTVSDPESGIGSSTGCSSAMLIAGTAGIVLTCSATNGAGLTASVPITIKIDKTAPVISGMPAPGCALWPPTHKLVQVATVTTMDALSGLAPGSFTVTGTSNEPIDPRDPQIDITPTSSGGFVIQLRADRLGMGNGRIYTLNAIASDLAGNTTTVMSACTVPHDQGH